MFGRNLKIGVEGVGGLHERAMRMALSSSSADGGQFDDVVGKEEVAGSVARTLGKGEFMEAAATPADEGGSTGGSMSGEMLLGAGRFCGEGGSAGSMPERVDSDSSVRGKARCIMFNAPRRLETAAWDVSLFEGLLVGLGPEAESKSET